MRIIITGTGGRLGAAVARHLRDRHRVIAWDRKALDLASPQQIDDHFGAVAFDAVIHCAAMTRLDECETQPALAHAVNALAPQQIATHCATRGAKMIYVSTDYVYDGTRPGLRTEADACHPLSVYAQSKYAGEQAVLATLENALVARASWIFGPDREGFVDQIIQRAQRETHGSAIADKWSTPSYSLDQAHWLEALLLNPLATGIVNLCNAGECSWQAYGEAALAHAAAAGVRLNYRTLAPQTCATMPGFTAQRPIHTAADTTKLAHLTGQKIRPWQAALADYISRYYGRA